MGTSNLGKNMASQESSNHPVDEKAELLKLSMQSLKEHYGLKPGKHRSPARAIGYQLGLEVAKGLSSTGFDDVIVELSAYWSRNGIGEMSWKDRTHLLLKIQDCSDCLGQSYGAGYTLCPFKEGLLEAVLDTKTNTSYKVKEIECCGTQAPGCVFQITEA